MSQTLNSRSLTAFIPAAFVFLWSTGFIGAKYGLPYAEPFTFLFIRMVITSALLYVGIIALRKSWPVGWKLNAHVAISGILVHVGYLGAIFSAISLGMPAGLCALVAGLQPILTAFLARPMLGEKVNPRQWIGLILGLLGIFLVLGEKANLSNPDQIFNGFGWDAILFAVVGLFGITLGALYQKRYCTTMPMLSGTFVQYAAASVAYGLLAYGFETMDVQWTLEFSLAMGWLVIALSIGAITLLMIMIKEGEAAKVASFFYLVPPATALEAYFLFDEKMGGAALLGLFITSFGVALAVRKK